MIERLEYLRRQLKARSGNPGMAKSVAAIKKQIEAIEASQARAEETGRNAQ